VALFEFQCRKCKAKFEQITKAGDPNYGKCPKCGSKQSEKLLSTFRVGGRGDLRESTLHGCHGPVFSPEGGKSHSCDGHCHHKKKRA
jgi:putative FmdB family regulatory protein